jgi:hypothetical protein
MSATVAGTISRELESSTAQVGAVSFSDLVRAHFAREQIRATGDADALDAADREFCERLEAFESREGKLEAAYWSTRNASAVAMTVGHPRAARNPLADTETNVRLHRVTDWVTRDVESIADALHDCDLLAIRVREILRGTSERIAMRWLYAVEEHLLGYIERTEKPDRQEQKQVVSQQRHELARIENYYLRTAAKAGRIVYVSGMLTGATLISAVCATLAIVLTHQHHAWNHDVRLLLLCIGSGAVGALVSVLSRMSASTDKFAVDFEVGRPLLRRLGLYKPLVGSVFGVGVYFLLASGLLMTKPPVGNVIYFYAIAAFLAGFSERFTGVMFGGAERLLGGDGESDGPPAKPAPTP